MWSKEKVRVMCWTLVGSMWECLCGHHRPTPRHSNGQKHKWHWKPLTAKTKVGIHSKWTILVGLCRIYGYANFSEQWGRELKYLFWSASWRTLLFPFEKNVWKSILTCTSEWSGVLVSISYGKEESLVRRLHSVQSCAGKVKDECPDLQTKYERLWTNSIKPSVSTTSFVLIWYIKGITGVTSNICDWISDI